MSWREIRPVALAVVRRGEELLLSKGYDPTAGTTYFRPLGGSIEFGEHSREAVVREFDEELGVELTDVEPLATLERTFTFDGEDGHELWRLYEGRIVEDWPYEEASFTAYEADHDEEFEVCWKHPSAFADGGAVVYPESLPAML